MNRQIRRLKKELSSPKEKVRVRAMKALASAATQEEVELLLNALSSDYSDVASGAKRALEVMGPTVAPTVLKAFIAKPVYGTVRSFLEGWREEIIDLLVDTYLARPQIEVLHLFDSSEKPRALIAVMEAIASSSLDIARSAACTLIGRMEKPEKQQEIYDQCMEVSDLARRSIAILLAFLTLEKDDGAYAKMAMMRFKTLPDSLQPQKLMEVLQKAKEGRLGTMAWQKLKEEISSLHQEEDLVPLMIGTQRTGALVGACLKALEAIGDERVVPPLLVYSSEPAFLSSIVNYAGPSAIAPLTQRILGGRLEGDKAKAIVKALEDILKKNQSKASYEDLERVANLSPKLTYQYTYTETLRGCWAGLTTSHQRTGEVDLTSLRQVAQQARRNRQPQGLSAADDKVLNATLDTLRSLVSKPSTSDSRAAAVRAVVKTRHPETLSLLKAVFPKVDHKVQVAILKGMTEIGGPESRAFLLQCWLGESAGPKEIAGKLLTAFGHEGVLDGLIDIYDEANEDLQIKIINAIKGLRSPRVSQTLANLPCQSMRIGQRIVKALSEQKGPDGLKALRHLRGSEQIEIRLAALRAISLEKDEDLEACIQALADPNPHLAGAALSILAEGDGQKGERVGDAIRGCLRHPQPTLRFAALRTLAERKDTKVLPIILQYADARGAEMRIHALQMLKHYEEEQAKARIAAALSDPEEAPRHIAIELLQELRTPSAIEGLVALLQSRPQEATKPVAMALKHQGWKPEEKALSILYHRALENHEALVKLGDHQAIEPLVRSLNRTHGFQKAKVIEIVAATESPEALAALTKLLYRDDKDLYGPVAKALASFPGRAGVDALIAYLYKDGKHWRYHAKQALVEEGGAKAVEPLLEISRLLKRASGAVDYLVSIVEKHAQDIPDAQLKILSNLRPRRFVTRTVEIACQTVLEYTNKVEYWEPKHLKQLAAQELARRRTSKPPG